MTVCYGVRPPDFPLITTRRVMLGERLTQIARLIRHSEGRRRAAASSDIAIGEAIRRAVLH